MHFLIKDYTVSLSSVSCRKLKTLDVPPGVYVNGTGWVHSAGFVSQGEYECVMNVRFKLKNLHSLARDPVSPPKVWISAIKVPCLPCGKQSSKAGASVWRTSGHPGRCIKTLRLDAAQNKFIIVSSNSPDHNGQYLHEIIWCAILPILLLVLIFCSMPINLSKGNIHHP